MDNQTNLPALRKYSKIKEVTIKKDINVDEYKNQHEYYYISFIETIEKTEEVKGLIRNKTIITTSDVKRIVPFSFKSIEVAKDFAQYLPGMFIRGFRLSRDFINMEFNISYETYKILIDGVDASIYIKLVKNTEHPQVFSRKNSKFKIYYENDLDINSPDATGEFYQYNELTVDYFFTDIGYDTKSKCIIPNMQYETISDIKNFENENTHKFVLIEQ